MNSPVWPTVWMEYFVKIRRQSWYVNVLLALVTVIPLYHPFAVSVTQLKVGGFLAF